VRLSRGQRSLETLLSLQRRNAALRAANRAFYADMSAQATAHELHRELVRYLLTAWQRDRLLDAAPSRHAGRLREHLWLILRARDHVPSERTIRRILADAEGAVDICSGPDFVASDMPEGHQRIEGM
jgi:hypothetical protein